ncbi:uncharacterized protein LOC135682739 [Rhopilema esculentum]|uniref:uncharacterized protein LOC135682739 n=1 Tax=Rhopilema esculentum TaxID=499914 RepID=UPI0031DDBB09
MLTYNNTKAQDDYLVIIGPEGSGPNLYKIATIILLFVAAVSLVALQMCRRRYFVLVWHWIICKKTLEHPEAVSEKRKKVVSIESTTCPSLSKSDDTGPDMVAKETHSMLALRIDDHIESPSNGTNFRKKFKRSDVYREPGKEEDQFEKAGLANSSEAAATADQIQAKQHVNDHGNDEFQKDEQLKSETKFLQSQRQQRHRRSGVCLSMLGRNSLPQTLKEVNADGQMEQANDLPLLQVNGIECEVDKECSEASIKSETKEEEDANDEGQIQCSLRFDKERNTLLVHSVTVKANIDPGTPGFFVEVALLPKQRISAKSRVYVTTDTDIKTTLKETFELSCLKPDLEQNSLFLAVKPIYSEVVLYAETDLKDLSLNNEREIMLGGYLKSMTAHYS